MISAESLWDTTVLHSTEPEGPESRVEHSLRWSDIQILLTLFVSDIIFWPLIFWFFPCKEATYHAITTHRVLLWLRPWRQHSQVQPMRVEYFFDLDQWECSTLAGRSYYEANYLSLLLQSVRKLAVHSSRHITHNNTGIRPIRFKTSFDASP